MRKYFGAMFVLFVALVLTVTSTALGAKPKPNPQVIITKACPAAKTQQTYKGNVIVYVAGNGCVSIDDGAGAIASGNATVVAHGKSVVHAKGNVVLVVFNKLVACNITSSVTLINASKYVSSYIRCQRPTATKK